MLNQNSREILYYKFPVFITDMMLHVGTLCLLLKQLDDNFTHGLESSRSITLTTCVLLAMAYTFSIGYIGIKLHERKINLYVVAWRAVLQTLLTYGIFTVLLVLTYKATPRTLLGIEICIMLPVIALWHITVNKLVRQFRRLGHNTRDVLIVGGGPQAAQLFKEMGMGQSMTGYNVVGYLNDWGSDDVPKELEYLGKLEALKAQLDAKPVDEIYCTLPPSQCQEQVKKVIKECNDRFIEFYYVPTMKGYPKRQMNIGSFGKVTTIKLREEPMNTLKCKFFKRTSDILISGLFVCTIYPFVCLFVWIGNHLFGNQGPLYFKQARTGYNGRDFYMIKFRSMRASADADTKQATKDDPRKTKFGNFLRKSSIDELPQFLNVLKGDMSIIGPRPHMLFHTEMFSELIGDYMVRHLARPGITGYAQVSGCRGETKTTEEMRDRVEHDIWYIENWTPLLDVMVFFKTILQLMPGRDKQAY